MRLIFLLLISLLIVACNSTPKSNDLVINYPFNECIFPPDISSPTIKWSDSQTNIKGYKISIQDASGTIIYQAESQLNQFKIAENQWDNIKVATTARTGSITISSLDNSTLASINFTTSLDSVNAPIFYRAVPLPFKFARENLEKVSWHLGNISDTVPAPPILENMPVCGNCHSFSGDGKRLAMDVDARDEKGAYVIADLNQNTSLNQSEIINWSDFQNGEFTYGLLSQISPDGKKVVSTLKDCEIFVDLNNMEYSQLFFPFKGILAYYSIEDNRFSALKGADDTTFVHSNPSWSPDGKYIYFCRSKAVQFNESGVLHGSVATDNTTYNNFLNNFIERKKLFKFDIYRIPFNNGKGGEAEAIIGASGNGKSNFFPKLSPDGKWLVYTQAESFMLLQKDSKLFITPANGGEPRLMNCNTKNMNSWHSWSPNGKWLVFSSKINGPHTQMYLTHIDENGNDSPPILLESLIISEKAANIPEFVNINPNSRIEITPTFLGEKDFKIRMAQINAKKNEVDIAFGLFNEILAQDGNNMEALIGRADIYMKKKMPAKALEDFNKAINNAPKIASNYIARGTAYTDLKEVEKAINDFSKAIELDPYSFMAYNNRGLIKFRTGRTEEALADYYKSLDLNDRAYMTVINIGVALAQLKKSDEALRFFDRAISINPRQAMAYSAKALLMLQAGNQTEGLNNLNKAIELEPENVEALTTRSKLLQNNSDYYNAINDYIKLTTITKKEGYFRIIVALCDEMKDFNKMKLATEKLLENNIIFGGEVNYYQAIALKTIGKVDEACEAMKQSADHGFHLARKKLDVFCKR